MDKLTPEKLDCISSNINKACSNCIKVGMSTCGLAAGAEVIYNIFIDELQKRNLPIKVEKCGCIGMCYAEPLIEVILPDMPDTIYGRVNKDVALKIIEQHLIQKKLVENHIYELIS